MTMDWLEVTTQVAIAVTGIAAVFILVLNRYRLLASIIGLLGCAFYYVHAVQGPYWGIFVTNTGFAIVWTWSLIKEVRRIIKKRTD